MANVTLSQTTIQLTETSADESYTIALDTNPTGPVTVRLSTDGQSLINVDGQGFRGQDTIVINDTTPKTVIVRVIDDGTPEGVHPGIITHTVAATEDEDNYPLNTELNGVSLQITDNDPGLYIQGTPTAIEGGENGIYEFGLSTAPDGNVTVEIETTDGQSEFSLDGGNTFVSSVEKTFTPTDFTTEIMVRGIQDNTLEGEHSSTITHTITESEAEEYSQGQTTQVFATITDNNPDLLTFDNQTLSIEEGQEDGTYTIKADGLDGDIEVTIKANGSSLIKVEDDQEFASEQVISLNSTTSEKTITVQATEDSDVTGLQTVSISHEITNSNSLNFPRGQVGDVTLNIADNDPGVIITQPTGQIEEGEENEYTIALSTNPDGPVTITLESDEDSDIKLPDGSVFEDELTITLSDTTPQTIKVQATADNDPSEGSPHESTITHTITATDDSDNYPTTTPIDNATIEIIDDSSSLFFFDTSPLGQTGVEDPVEEGNQGNYTLRLVEEPRGDVRVTIQADDQTEISIDGGVTFAESQEVRFSDLSAKTITVKPINDSTVEGAHTSTISHTITEAPDGSDFKINSKVGDVTVTITDNDPGLIITPATEPTEEGGDLTTYEVALSTTPTNPVTVTITTDGESELSLDQNNLNFATTRNIQLSDTTPTLVTVRGTTDDEVEGLHTSTLTHEITDSTDPNYPEREGTSSTNIQIKDGTPGVIISNQSLSLSEGEEATYTITLTTEPTEDVMVTITADEQGLISVDGQEFASEQVITLNQSTLEKEIKVQAIDDDPPEGIHSSIITHSIASADENYSNENTPIEDVTATITDNDIGIVIIGTPQVTEGSTDTYEIGLSTQPTGDVTVTITADNDDTEISIDGTNFAATQDVTFSNLTLQTITVRVENDEEFQGLRDRIIKHEISESQDITNYPVDLEIPDVTAEITDDEPGVVIISNLDLTEGGIGTYEIGLNTPPVGGGSVTVTITADPQTRISIDGGINFASNQEIQLRGTTRQTITVQVFDDTGVEGDHQSTISHEITDSDDTTNYPLGQEIDDVTIKITDNDPGLIFSDAIAITEGGEEGTYTVALNTVPTGEVTVTLTADDDSLIKVGDQEVSEGEFAQEQVITLNPEKLQETISVQAANDLLVEGTHTSTISHEVTDTEDTTNYPTGTSGFFTATITDNDPGIVFSETTLSAEEGQEDTYTIGLSTVPTSDVTVTITADDQSLIKVGDGEFAPEQEIILNAETLEKEITVQGLDDDQVEGDHTSTISHEITASEDSNYPLGDLEQEVTVDLTDNDSGLIFSQAITITENNDSGTYTVSLNTPPTGEVEITIQADDQSTISLDGINFGTQRIITLNPETLEETITVRAFPDTLVEGVHTSTISHRVSRSEDLENYPLGEGPSYTANITDDDPGIVFIDGPVSIQEGQEGIYTVALSTRPTGDVTIQLTADDQSVIKVDDQEFASEQVIIFNAETLEKEITVQPVDDDQVEGDHTSQISYEVTASEDENYTVGLDGELTTNITDPAQVVITPISPLEEGEIGEYTIALNSVPAGAVEITITADENSEISLDGQTFDNTVVVSLTDTNPTTITVEALDDDLPDGDQTSTISYAITSSGDLDKYPLDLEIAPTEITITDNDIIPGEVLISEISPLTEGGETQQYTIALDTLPAGAVEITITADDNSEISLDGETFSNEVVVSLTDTTPTTITVQALDDETVEGDHNTSISYAITNTEDPDKYPSTLEIPATEISITDNDADAAGQVIISEISGLTEGGEPGTYTIALDTAPAGPVEIKITADDNSEIRVDGETFSNEVMVTLDDTTPTTITVQAVDDDQVEGDHTSTISYEITSTGDEVTYPDTLNIPSTEITITDNDEPALGQVIISEISGLAEGGEPGTYTIALDTEPAGPVEITITADENSEIRVDGETFSNEVMVTLDDTTPTTITVQAVDDESVEGDHTSTISYEITSTGDEVTYPDTLEIPATEISITDNDADAAGQVIISEISGLTEGGEAQEYTIALDTEPAGPVEITITADDNSEISVDGETFDNEVVVSLSDTTPTTITVQAVDDESVEGDHTSTISYEITSTGDEVTYPDTLNIPSTEITITDNDEPAPGQVIISEISGLTEGGEPGTYTIALDTEPAGPVEIKITADDNSEILIDGETFSNEVMVTLDDTTATTITVQAVDDDQVEGDHTSTISYEITSTGDEVTYPSTLEIPSTEITITDNDEPTAGQVIISEISGLTEGAEPGTYTIALDTEPAGPVEITITADENSEIRIDGETFSNEVMVTLEDTTAKTITVQAVDDDLPEGDHTSTISYEITNTGDEVTYPLTLEIPSTEITITDNDADGVGQVNISEISGLTEGAEPGTYTIALDTEPAGPVEIKITADENSEIRIDGETFSNEVMVTLEDTTATTITVQAVDDDLLEGDHTSTISYEITSTGDEVTYPLTLNIPSTEISITDNESVTTTPQILISESPILFEGGTGIYTVELTNNPTGEVEITINADDQTEISLDGTTFASEQVLTFNEATLQTITVRGLDDQEVEGDHESTISHEITRSEDTVNYPVGAVELVTANIFDNDIPIVTISASDLEAAETDQDPGSITITRSGDTSEELTVSYVTVGSTATADDYSETLNGSVTIAAGESSVELKITPEIDFLIDEGDETVNLILNTSQDYNLVGNTFAQITIADDTSSVPDNSTRLVWRNPVTEENILWKIDATQQVTTVTLPTLDLNFEIQGSGDLDGDGDNQDVLLVNTVTGAIQYWQAQGEEINQVEVNTGEVNLMEWEIQEIADFDGDSKDDLVAYKPDTGEVAILTINGEQLVNQGIIERNGQPLLITEDSGWQIQGAGNFNGDNGPDQILWHNQNTGQVGIWEIDGNELADAAFVTRDDEPVLAPSSTGWQIEAVADFSGDGQEQILWYNSDNGYIAIWQMSNKELVQGERITQDGQPLSVLPSDGWSILGVADVNQDGLTDIVWNNNNDNTIAVWKLNGSELSSSVSIEQPPEPGSNPILI